MLVARIAAPYASTAIPLYLGSVIGLRYRTLHCIECGGPLIERNADVIIRIGQSNSSERAHVSADGMIHSKCERCQQKYTLTLSMGVETRRGGIPLYMQPQALVVISEPVKKLRDTHCLECGKAFFSISDRVKLIADNIAPVASLPIDRVGPMEPRCRFQHCKQRWHVTIAS